MKSSIVIALAQWDIKDGDPDYNTKKLFHLATIAKDKDADILLVPEMWYIGYDYKNFDKYASDLSKGAFAVIGRSAREHNMAICATSVRRQADSYYNTMVFVDKTGELILTYDKIFLFGPMGEAENFKSGDTIAVCEWEDWKIGLAICYDLRFPELFRKEMKKGVHLFLINAQWPTTRITHWDLLLQARAIENQAFVAGCNRIGENENYEFSGKSAIIDPGGNTIVKTNGNEGVWIGKVAMKELLHYRDSLPFLRDRREDVFGR